MSNRVRLLPFVVADGPWNMAADEALLTSAVDDIASLRFYGWSRATLSLGYFQPAAPALSVSGLACLPWLRRPSGGAALVHHRELTYALALPPGPAWRPPADGWIWNFHDILRTALASLGIVTNLCEQEQKNGEVLCFLHHTPGDLLLGECKIAGSAQRKRRGALLQHGSVLLGQSPFTPALPGIAELDGTVLSAETLISALIDALTHATGWTVEPGDWTAREVRAIEEVLSRYGSSNWNNRR
jgi:lipoate-protein ligase A